MHCRAAGPAVDCHSGCNFEKSDHPVDLTVEGRIMLIFTFLDCLLEDRSSWAAFADFTLLISFFFNFSFQLVWGGG